MMNDSSTQPLLEFLKKSQTVEERPDMLQKKNEEQRDVRIKREDLEAY